MGGRALRQRGAADAAPFCWRALDAPGIPEAKARIIQDALDAQDYAHHMGLGLMLADLIARAHQGRLNILKTDGGVTVEISLRDFASAAPAAA